MFRTPQMVAEAESLQGAIERRREAAKAVMRQLQGTLSTSRSSNGAGTGENVQALAERAGTLTHMQQILELALSAEQNFRSAERELRRSAVVATEAAASGTSDCTSALKLCSEGAHSLAHSLSTRALSVCCTVMHTCCDTIEHMLLQHGWPPAQAGPRAASWAFPSGEAGDTLQRLFVASSSLSHAALQLCSSVAVAKSTPPPVHEHAWYGGSSKLPTGSNNIFWLFQGGAVARAALLAHKRAAKHFTGNSSLARLDKPEWLLAHAFRIASEHSQSLHAHLSHGVPNLRNAFACEIAIQTRELFASEYCPRIAKIDSTDARLYWVHLAEECAGFCSSLRAAGCEPKPSPPPGGGPLAALCTHQRWESSWHDAEFGDVARMLDSLSQEEWECEYDSTSASCIAPVCARQAAEALSHGAERRCSELEAQQALRYLEHVTATSAEDFHSRCSRRAQQAEWRTHHSDESCCKSIASAASAACYVAESLERMVLQPHISRALSVCEEELSRLERATNSLRQLAESLASTISAWPIATPVLLQACLIPSLLEVVSVVQS